MRTAPGDSVWIVFQTEAVGSTTRLGIPGVICVDDLRRRIYTGPGVSELAALT